MKIYRKIVLQTSANNSTYRKYIIKHFLFGWMVWETTEEYYLEVKNLPE